MRYIFAIIVLLLAIIYSINFVATGSHWKTYIGIAAAALAFYIVLVVLYEIFLRMKSRL